MLQDTDFFDKLETWSDLGDVHATVQWDESPAPDEAYTVQIVWKFRDRTVGEGDFTITPIIERPGDYRLYWVSLVFKNDWQDRGLYTQIVKQYAPNMLRYRVVETVATPWDMEAQRRLASQGFEWRDRSFVLDFAKALDDSKPS